MGSRVDFQPRQNGIPSLHTQKVSTLLREATLGSTASGLHGPDTPAGSVLLSGQSIVLGSELAGKAAGYGETELLGGLVFVR